MTYFFFQEPGLAQVLFEGRNDLLYNFNFKVFSIFLVHYQSHTFVPCFFA
jgi:hypothetical protein